MQVGIAFNPVVSITQAISNQINQCILFLNLEMTTRHAYSP